MTKLYLFSVVAIDKYRGVSHIIPNLLIDESPQSAAAHGLESAKKDHPECQEYQVGVVHRINTGSLVASPIYCEVEKRHERF